MELKKLKKGLFLLAFTFMANISFAGDLGGGSTLENPNLDLRPTPEQLEQLKQLGDEEAYKFWLKYIQDKNSKKLKKIFSNEILPNI